MNAEKIQTATGISILALTKYLMKTQNISQDEAYKTLMKTELYNLILDSETNLFLEPDNYLVTCLETELTAGSKALKEFITKA